MYRALGPGKADLARRFDLRYLERAHKPVFWGEEIRHV
jgi:hypothetical protein